MAEGMLGALESTQAMIDGIASIESLSRDMRPPLRKLRQGLTVMFEAREVADEWLRLIDATEIVCEEAGEAQ